MDKENKVPTTKDLVPWFFSAAFFGVTVLVTFIMIDAIDARDQARMESASSQDKVKKITTDYNNKLKKEWQRWKDCDAELTKTTKQLDAAIKSYDSYEDHAIQCDMKLYYNALILCAYEATKKMFAPGIKGFDPCVKELSDWHYKEKK